MKASNYYRQERETEVEEIYKKPSATTLTLKREASCSNSYSSDHKINNPNSSIFSKPRYKLWALIIILLLAFWSMFTGSVTLNWSSAAGILADDFDSPLHSDLDVLEVEEREKVVRHMWDVYTHSRTIRLPKFWQQAFEAAYEDLTSDLPSVRNSAVSEIAKMSLLSLELIADPPPLVQSTAKSTSVRTNPDIVELPLMRRASVRETTSSKLQKSRRQLLHFGD